MSNTIAKLVGLQKARLTEGLYGVEIEVEGERLPTYDHLYSTVWRVERDGSLKAKEAWEYVMPKPLSLEGVRKSLTYLNKAYKSLNSVVYDSVRAGVHVHMNVQNWTAKQLFTFCVAYYILEDRLLEYCGPTREGNLFTLRIKDGEYGLLKVLQSIQTRNLRSLNTDLIRYSSLNFCSMFKYGSLEFRGMRGTRDLDLIYEWVCILNDLREASMTFNSPIDVIECMSADGEYEFVRRALPNFHHLFPESDKFNKSIREAVRRVQMIAYEGDWDNIGKTSLNIFNNEIDW